MPIATGEMAHAFVLCTGPIGGAVSLGKGRVLVSVQGDGVTCYDVDSRKPVLAWPLGGVDQDFSPAAVYDYATNLCFAPVRSRAAAVAKSGGSVLAWSADAAGGTITQLAHPIHLPALHSLFPLTVAPEGEAAEAAAAEEEEQAAAEVDGSGDARPGALAVFAAGGAALCSGSEVVAEAEEASGHLVVAAAYQAGVAVVVHADARGGAAAATVYRVQGGTLAAEAPVELVPPSEGCRAVAAAATPERTAVLWSDGTVAAYLVPGDTQPLIPGPDWSGSRRRPAAQRRLGGLSLPAGKQQKGGKKRSGGAVAAAEAGAAGMAAMGEKQVAVAAWATDAEGATVLRLVVLETSAACVQLAQDWAAADLGLAAFDPSKPLQVESLGPGSNQLAITAGGAVLVATCHDLKPPTLINLLGALALDRALAAQRHGGGGGAGQPAGLMPAPGAAPAAAGVSPAALAAARVLHADELAALTSPFGGAPRPMEVTLEREQPTEVGQWLVRAKAAWRVAGAGGEAAHEQLAAAEAAAWRAAQQPPALASDAAMQAAVVPALAAARATGFALSPRLVCKLILLAAEHKHWGAAAAVLEVQHPGLLDEVPGVAAAAAEAGQYGVLERLLAGSVDASPAELTPLLAALLSPAASEAAEQGRQQRHAAAQAAAAAAAEAARQAEQAPADPQQQQEQPQQQAPEPGTPGRAGGRRQRHRQRGEEAAGAEAWGAAAADAEQQPQQLAQQQGEAPQLPPAAPLLVPGARERAAAACCAAAVQGFSADHCGLHSLAALPRRPDVLRQALRGLSAGQAVQLLRYVTVLLRNHADLVGSCTVGWEPPLALPPGVVLPTLAQALEWANATLDGALIKLSHEPEAEPLLQELRQLVDAQVAATRPLLRLEGVVSQLLAAAQQQAAARWAADPADYSVQWLDLRIQPGGEQQQQQQQQPGEA